MGRSKPSRTAYKVALNILALGSIPEMNELLPPGIIPATERLLISSGAVNATMVRWARSRRMVFTYDVFHWLMPGQFTAFGHRKAFCERQVREGIGTGVSQVLVLGAGYDTMGWRLAPEFPRVNFFEIDHPATAKLKAKGIEAMGQRDNLCLIPEDLAKRKLVDLLKENKLWNANAQTAIIAEGLLMYLSSDAVHELFCQSAAITGAGSRIALSYVPSGADGRPDCGRWTGLMLWLLRLIGEPWLWSIKPEELGAFLEKTGWTSAPQFAGSTDKHGVEFYAVATK